MARTPYLNSKGGKLPSVTEVLGAFKDPGPLMHWAWKEGKEGRDYRKSRGSAAAIGNVAHELVEADILFRQPKIDGYAPEAVEAAQVPLQAFRQWRREHDCEILHTETKLVSERHQYGGTLDGIGRVDGKLVLADWKTSKRVYAEYVDQVAAYRQLWLECHGELAEGAILLRLDKDQPIFEPHYFNAEQLDLGLQSFLGLLTAYKARKQRECLHTSF